MAPGQAVDEEDSDRMDAECRVAVFGDTDNTAAAVAAAAAAAAAAVVVAVAVAGLLMVENTE